MHRDFLRNIRVPPGRTRLLAPFPGSHFPLQKHMTRTNSSTTALRFIAVTKLVKALLVVVIGLGAFRLINKDLEESARNLTMHLRIDPENHYARLLFEKVAKIDSSRLRHYGVVSFFFAAELFTEGVGLWLNQNWAKYMVIGGTGFFIPFEAYSCIQRFDWERLLLLIVNVAIVIYVAVVVRREHRHPPPAG